MRIHWPEAETVLLTAFVCAVAAYFYVARRERRAAGLPSPRQMRKLQDPHPYHPDLDVELSWDERHQLAGIVKATRHQPAPDRIYDEGRQP